MSKLKKTVVLLAVLSVLVSFSVPVLAEEAGKININTAPIEELVKLDQVGPKYAALIVEYRKTNGPFKSPEEIVKVKGIGEKTYESNKDIITVK